MKSKTCYHAPPPGVDLAKLTGTLIVIEGPDASGRSTQVRLLSEWLEQKGYAVTQTGLSRSVLVSNELESAKEGNVLSPRTLSLFYATDFYDQMENIIVPALRAGYVVLADRYIYTLMARDLVRGARRAWLDTLYSMALVPDAVFFLSVSAHTLVERTLNARGTMDYWESGMDIGISRDLYDSFTVYQRRIRNQYKKLQQTYGFEMINGDRTIDTVQKDIRSRVEIVVEKSYKPQ